MKRVITLMLSFLLCFVIVNLFLFYKTGLEPSTLIGCVFAFCGAEGSLMAWLKGIERKGKKNETSEEWTNGKDE